MEVMQLKEYLFKPVLNRPTTKDTLSKYTSLLLNDSLLRREEKDQITAEAIYSLLNIPFYVATKIFLALNEDRGCFIDRFAHWLIRMFNGSIRERIVLLFNVLDFDKDGVVYKEDILFLFREFFIVKYGKMHLKEFKKIMKRIKFKLMIKLNEFIEYITIVNSDALYLFYLFIQDSNYYQEKYIKKYFDSKGGSSLFCNTNNSTILFEKQNELIDPSARLIHFAYDTLGCNQLFKTVNQKNRKENKDYEDDDYDDELTALDEFEQSVSSHISNMFELTRVTHVSNTVLISLMDKNCNFFETHSIDKKSITNSAKHLSFSMDKLLLPKTKRDFKNDLQSQGIKVNIQIKEGRISKGIITIIDKLLFIETKSKKTSKFKLKSILSLNHYYTNNVTEHQIVNSKKLYVKTIIDSNSIVFDHQITFYSAKIEKIKGINELIDFNNQYKNINDYYTINEQINEGKFGKIYQAISKTNNRKVAIKKVSKSIPYSSSLWEKEIFIILKNSQQENITTCIELFESAKDIYFVFEYLSFGNLRTFIQRDEKWISNEQKIIFVNQLIKAVSFLHKQGIIHRDLKPDNLMIDFSKGVYIIKVTDYGLGKIMSPIEETNESYGSLAYSSPEIVSGGYYSFESDIWSIGMLTYFIYSSFDPFDNSDVDILEVREMITSANIKWLYANLALNEAIIHFLNACFQKTNRPHLNELYMLCK